MTVTREVIAHYLVATMVVVQPVRSASDLLENDEQAMLLLAVFVWYPCHELVESSRVPTRFMPRKCGDGVLAQGSE